MRWLFPERTYQVFRCAVLEQAAAVLRFLMGWTIEKGWEAAIVISRLLRRESSLRRQLDKSVFGYADEDDMW